MINTLVAVSFSLIGDGASTSVDIDLDTQLTPEVLPQGPPAAVAFLNVSAPQALPQVTITGFSLKKSVLTINFSGALGSNFAVGSYSISGGLLY